MANSCYVTGKASALNVEDLKKFLDVMENEKFMDFDYEEIEDWGEGERKTVKFYGDRITEIRLIKCGEKGSPENAEYDDRQTESPSHDIPEEVKQAVGTESDDDDIFEI